MKKLLLTFMLVLFSAQASAYTQCTRTPNKTYLNVNGSSIWICFTTSGCIYKNSADDGVEDVHLNRLYATGLTAITTGKKLIVRYTTDNVNCSSLTSTKEFLGVWLQ